MLRVETTSETELPDWSREECRWSDWDPSRRLLRAIRRYQKWRHRWGVFGTLLCKLTVLEYRFWSVVCAADIPINTRIGGGLLLTHPNGVVIHPDAVIGPNCLISAQVTIGVARVPGVPRIGSHVDIGAGAKILGGIVIGDGARIGANAVVLHDVPAGATAVGIPARLVGDTQIDKQSKHG